MDRERARVRAMADELELTEDLMYEAILRVPVKSLLRFRCVSKRWCALIDSKAFVKQHINHSILTKSRSTHLVFDTYRYGCFDIILSSFKGLYSLFQSSQQLVMPIKRPNHRCIHLLGSCNGLLCIQLSYANDETHIFIWNTATRKHLKLPDQRLYRVFAYGFGYDSVSDDYKVVVMLAHTILSRQCLHKRMATYVYTLRSNAWRKFHDNNSPTYPISHLQLRGVLVCGVIHWIATRRDPHGVEYVFAFDLATETDMIITLPEFGHDDDDGQVLNVLAAELGGCLSIVRRHPKKVGVFDVWVMKELWIKLLTLSGLEINRPIIQCLFPLAYSKSGDKVLLMLNFQTYNSLFWFNLENRIVELVDVREYLNCRPVICFESLVSLGDKAEND